MATIGVIGLGLMGSALAERFHGARVRVAGFDPRDEGRQRLAATGGEAMDSVCAVFGAARTVVLSLPSSDATRAVIEEAGESVRGATIIDTTTGEPDATEDI